MLHHRQQIGRLWTGLVLVTALLLGAWPGTAAAQAATIRVEPPQVRGDPGQDLRVQIVIEDVENLGFFQFDVTFDPAVVQFKSVALGEFLASTGREATAVGPLTDNEQGRLTFGAFTVGDQAGPDGSGVLAEVTLTGVANGATALSLANVQLLTAQNSVIVAITPGQAVVTVGDPAALPATPRATPTSQATTPGTAPPAATSPATTPAQGAVTPETTLPAATSSPAPAQGVATPDSATATSTSAAAPSTAATAPLAAQPTAEPAVAAANTAAPQSTAQATDEPAVVLATAETGSAGAAETSAPESAQPAATLAAAEPSPTPSAAATPLVRPAAGGAGPSEQSSTEAPRWLLVVGAGALALAGLIAAAIVVLVRRPGS